MSKDILTLAREAGFLEHEGTLYTNHKFGDCFGELERFAELVRADEREKYKWDIHSCGPTCKRYACVAMREAVEAENEACAKVCEQLYKDVCADAIRARRKK